MSAPELRLSYTPDYEWHGQLNAFVRSGAFSGEGSAWFDRARLKETFIAALHPRVPESSRVRVREAADLSPAWKRMLR